MAMPAACCLLLFLLLPLSSGSALPGCPTHCGDMEVPFPFGIIGVRSNCSFDYSFEILCNTSSNPPKAYLPADRVEVVKATYLPISTVEIIEIRSDVSQLRVKYPNLAITCYDLPDNETTQQPTVQSSSSVIDLAATAFALSDQNWITVLGCDDLVTVTARNHRRSCMSYCTDMIGTNGSCLNDNGNSYSSGNGCCRTDLPKGANVLGADVADLTRTLRKSSKQFPCSYAFIGAKGQDQFSFKFDALQNITTFLDQNPGVMSMPLVLDWRIRGQNCTEARKDSTAFACKENSSCVDYEVYDSTDVGYICNCANGYEGNPYLPGIAGCQDIDECANETTNSCKFICTNTPGSYSCSCPKGYVGDGRKDGEGCKKLPYSKMITVIIGLASGLGFLLLLATCFGLYKVFQKRKNKNLRDKFFKRNGGLLLQQQQKTNEGYQGKVNLFTAKELEKATDNFNENMIVGRGGQGTVYKGMLSTGKLVAIKTSKLLDEDQLELFINEVVILSQINHRNVIKLLGCCLETEVPILVYEFVPNGTLSDLIHDGRTEFLTPWSIRLKIATDIAGALAYLHSASSVPIFHRDIKSSNILLDEKYIAKIADFGTSKLVEVDQTHITTLVKGTFGYFDPEYFQSSQFTEKSDVYSFGVVMVELLTGQKPVSSSRTQQERSLAARFLLSMETNSLDTILDAVVLEQGRRQDVNATARLAQKCLNLKGRMRPTMKEVAIELERIRMSQMPSTGEVSRQEPKLYESKSMSFWEDKHTWTTSDDSATIPSTETHPLMLETM